MSPHAGICAVERRHPPVATPAPARTVLRASVIYVAVSGVLCLVAVGIPLFVTVALLDTIFCILAGAKARDGLVWRYPLSIRSV